MPHPQHFASLGEMVLAVAASAAGGPPDQRFAASGQNVASGSEGGFLVPSAFAADLVDALYDESILAPLCDRRRSVRGRRGLKLPVIDERSRAEGSRMGGVRTYWIAEAESVPASKPQYGEMHLQPHKLAALTWVTEELLGDVPALEEHLRSVFATELAFRLDGAIPFGTGVGMPLGFMNSPALVSVPKEPGQPAGTIVIENVVRMWQRLPAASRRRAVWIANEDAEAVIATLERAKTVYRPADGDRRPDPTLFGRPIIAIEQAPALGELGDIALADLSQYRLLDAGTRTDLSLHVRFVEDEAIIRMVMSVDGQPGWASPVTAANGSMTRSPFVALAARA